jgi:nitric oxide dioxygenase
VIPTFEPGQYITIRVQIPGEKYACNRQYSLSGTPGKEYFRISVKKEAEPNTPKGKVSNYLHEHVNIGGQIEITAPAGDFTLNLEKQMPVVLISGGVGITPFMSMVNGIAESQPHHPVSFIHASKNGNVQAFKEESKNLKNTLSNYQLSFVYGNPSEEDVKDIHFSKQGYIDSEWLKTKVISSNADYYICGPVSFLRAIVTSLKELGVNSERIHFEFFGPAINL